MWAMIPMLRTRSRPTACSFSLVLKVVFLSGLPAVVGERLVRLCHPVDVVLSLERAALLVERVQNLVGQLVAHALFPPFTRIRHEPPDCERPGPALRHLDGNLVVRTADTAAADFQDGSDRLHGLLEYFNGRTARFSPDRLERLVD